MDFFTRMSYLQSDSAQKLGYDSDNRRKLNLKLWKLGPSTGPSLSQSYNLPPCTEKRFSLSYHSVLN